ncbi:MAG: winged helix-turn-helix transcriptional regulator [Trueperaceae bacterium]|nr:winged helix-turn-helix transcriptional regulator [Trueperaceae bacterium]
MARLPTTADAYNAIAEPQRRKIISVLADGEKSVGELVEVLELNQPQISKHLKVLKEVDLVIMRKDGKQRIYSLNADNLKPIYDWLSDFAHLWTERFDRLESYLATLKKEGRNE